ncbi:hypothetical protein CWI37_2844p0010, partial [Hamiltosporidium tvaerminnensis]
ISNTLLSTTGISNTLLSQTYNYHPLTYPPIYSPLTYPQHPPPTIFIIPLLSTFMNISILKRKITVELIIYIFMFLTVIVLTITIILLRKYKTKNFLNNKETLYYNIIKNRNIKIEEYEDIVFELPIDDKNYLPRVEKID